MYGKMKRREIGHYIPPLLKKLCLDASISKMMSWHFSRSFGQTIFFVMRIALLLYYAVEFPVSSAICECFFYFAFIKAVREPDRSLWFCISVELIASEWF